MDASEEEKLHAFTVDLSKKAIDIRGQIGNQGLLLESIQYQAQENSKAFERNRVLFGQVLSKLDQDKRNYLIIFLLIVIVILIYILKL